MCKVLHIFMVPLVYSLWFPGVLGDAAGICLWFWAVLLGEKLMIDVWCLVLLMIDKWCMVYCVRCTVNGVMCLVYSVW